MSTTSRNDEAGTHCTPADEARKRNAILVLFADDDEINREIVARILTESRNFKLTVAVDGREALKACLKQKFDVLIVDYKMPGITGDRLIRHLRSSLNPNATTPAILFSASTPQELRPVVAKCGASAVLSKPIDAAAFISTVGDLVCESAAGSPRERARSVG